MITLTAQMRIQGKSPSPFTLGVSRLGEGALFGETIYEEVKFDRRNSISLESEVKDRADIDKPSFGIISTGGSLSFKDTTSRFLNYANAGALTEGIEIKIFVENTVKKTRKQVGQYYTADWDYDNDNCSASVSFKDDLEEWQEILTDEIEYDFENLEEKNLEWFYKKLNELTPKKYNMTAFEDLDLETKSVLTSTTIKYPYMDAGNLWSSWQKLCDAGLLHIYKENGKTICRYNGGN